MFKEESFATGAEKLARLDVLLDAGKLVGVSIQQFGLGAEINQKLVPLEGGCHVMLVVEWDVTDLHFFYAYDDTGDELLAGLSRADLVDIHNKWPGDKEIVYLESWE